ncbi:MAG: flagellar motor switch protein FliM [Bacteriovoracaceae bacterium]|nr:flagellar motor switch protein FliM [Bacteriovoracaceae bacterium]
MNQVLSQDEIDALLNAVNDTGSSSSDSGGGAAAKSAPGANVGKVTNVAAENPFGKSSDNIIVQETVGDNVQTYDITNQDRIIRGRMPMMDLINDRFTRSYRVSLSSLLRKTTSVNVINRDMSKFGELLTTLPIPTCLCVLRFNELRGPALLVIESKLAYAFIDSFFGGKDRPFTKIDGKEFTKIELTFMKRIMDLTIRDLEEAWAPIQKLDIQYVRAEINPQFVGIVPPSEVILNTTYEIEFESASGTVMIVLPYSTIEPIKQKLSSTFQTDSEVVDTVWASTLTHHIKSAPTTAIVKLGEADISIADMLSLQVGDIIPLNQEISGELNVEIEEVPKLKGLLGIYKGSKAVQVTRRIEESSR